jgi:hypothetical protein
VDIKADPRTIKPADMAMGVASVQTNMATVVAGVPTSPDTRIIRRSQTPIRHFVASLIVDNMGDSGAFQKRFENGFYLFFIMISAGASGLVGWGQFMTRKVYYEFSFCRYRSLQVLQVFFS